MTTISDHGLIDRDPVGVSLAGKHTNCLTYFSIRRYLSTGTGRHWLFLTYKHVLSILQVVSFGTLLSYPSLALGVGY